MGQPLAHTLIPPETGAVENWLLVLHGIFGTRANWRGFARSIVQSEAGTGALLLDLRMHGDSTGYSPPHTLAACAQDIRETLIHLEQAEVLQEREITRVLGHSFGGKVALELCRPSLLNKNDFAPRQLWMIDVAPGMRNIANSPDSPSAVLEIIEQVAADYASRKEFIEALLARALSEPLAQWLAMNLRRSADGRYRWDVEPSALADLLADFAQVDLWPVIEQIHRRVNVNVVVAGRSTSWNREQLNHAQRLEELGKIQIHRLDAAGHWVHVDDPVGLRKVMLQGRL